MSEPGRGHGAARAGGALALLALLAGGCPRAEPAGQSAARPVPAQAAPAGPTDALAAGGAAGARAAAALDRLVRARCLDPNEPWALTHALLCYGRDLEVGGASAVDLLARGLDPGTLRFPKGTPQRPVEPHPGMIAKTVLEAGVPPERTVALPDGASSTWGAVAAAQAAAYTPSAAPVPLRDQAWLLELAAATRDPRSGVLAGKALKVLAENQAYFQAYADDPQRAYDKPHELDPQGRPRPVAIHRYFCGGFHLFQAVQRLHGGAAPPELAAQYRLVWTRLERETAYWRSKLAQARQRAEGPDLQRHERLILSQLLKLQGHALETVLRAYRAGALPLSAEDRARVDAGFGALAQTVADLEACGALDALDAIRQANPQLYLDLVGDGAHALHAFMLARGA